MNKRLIVSLIALSLLQTPLRAHADTNLDRSILTDSISIPTNTATPSSFLDKTFLSETSHVAQIINRPEPQRILRAAGTVTNPWQCGNNAWATLDDNDTLTISGTGAMMDYDYYNLSPWNSETIDIKEVTIEDGITSIGNFAFYACLDLTDIDIPNSVTKIGEYAFAYTGLTSINLPDKVTSIGEYAFADTDLTSINLPDKVNSIGNHAFAYCSKLTSIRPVR